MKIFGIILLIFGLLVFGGGCIGAVVSQLIPNDECALADQYKAEADRLDRDADAARGKPDESKLREQALDKMKSARVWAEGCRDRKKVTTMAMIAGIIAAVFGLIMAIVGSLLFLRARRAAA